MSTKLGAPENLTVGDTITYQIETVPPTDSPRTYTAKLLAMAGGGFHGKVYILSDRVIKTSSPSPFREFLRQMNWEIPFPPRASWAAAQRAVLIGRLLHNMMPIVTGGCITTPETYGHTVLNESEGYSLVLERVQGRGARFDIRSDNQNIAHARQLIWEIGQQAGLATTAQVHPNNPFGKPNIWIDLDNPDKMIWFDVHPAIPHHGLVWPGVKYSFHYDVQKALETNHPTFDDIHFGKLEHFIHSRQDLFNTPQLEELYQLITLLKTRTELLREWTSQDATELHIQDLLHRKKISLQQAQQFRLSEQAWRLHTYQDLSELTLTICTDFLKNSAKTRFFDPAYWKNVKKILTDADFRTQELLSNTILRGLTKGLEHGLVTPEEYMHALDAIPRSDLLMYLSLQLMYVVLGRVVDALSLALLPLTITHPNPVIASAMLGIFNTLLPGVIRFFVVTVLHNCSDAELKKLAFRSIWPGYGTYMAIPTELSERYGEQTNLITHYMARAIVARISSILPSGGWQSDAEERIWNQLQYFGQYVATQKANIRSLAHKRKY